MTKHPSIIIQAIVAEVLGLDLVTLPHLSTDFVSIPDSEADDESHILYFLQNQHLLNEQTYAQVVAQQLAKFPTTLLGEFEINMSAAKAANFAQRWQTYIDKLEYILKQVQYRQQHGYERCTLLPPLRQILALQHECWQLTCEYYGANQGNISCFYQYYIRMCESANITRYTFAQIDKYLAADHYVAHINLQQRKLFTEQHAEQVLRPSILAGGVEAQGRTDIDATSISNVFYYKTARQYLYFRAAKQYIVDLVKLGFYKQDIFNFGQLPQNKKEFLWSLLQEKFPVDPTLDIQSIFYKFVVHCNRMPGSCFTQLPDQMQQYKHVAPQIIHSAIKLAGISCGKLILLDRCATEDWTPKRYLVASWQRKYPLLKLRAAGTQEHMRVCPNEMPYSSAHGLSLCGNGLREGLEQHQSWRYSWNAPVDVREEVDNSARDIEKIFRELKLLSPQPTAELLPGETLLNIFQNTVAYSTQNSQHTHITQGTIESYPIYNLPPIYSRYIDSLSATVSLIQVGHNIDACFLKVQFSNIENEAVIQFLIKFYNDTLEYFSGRKHVDFFIQLFPTLTGEFAFIFEPHVSLTKLDNGDFFNPETKEITIRKPFWFIPQGENIRAFAIDDELSTGIKFLRKFYDSTRKQEVYNFMQQYISRLL